MFNLSFAEATAVAVYLTFRELPDECRPGRTTRFEDMTIVSLDPRSTRYDTVEHMVTNLTLDEQNVVRAGYGIPPAPHPLDDWAMADIPALLYVPPALRLHGMPAFQGGAELERRLATDAMQAEWRALAAEDCGLSVDAALARSSAA